MFDKLRQMVEHENKRFDLAREMQSFLDSIYDSEVFSIESIQRKLINAHDNLFAFMAFNLRRKSTKYELKVNNHKLLKNTVDSTGWRTPYKLFYGYDKPWLRIPFNNTNVHFIKPSLEFKDMKVIKGTDVVLDLSPITMRNDSIKAQFEETFSIYFSKLKAFAKYKGKYFTQEDKIIAFRKDLPEGGHQEISLTHSGISFDLYDLNNRHLSGGSQNDFVPGIISDYHRHYPETVYITDKKYVETSFHILSQLTEQEWLTTVDKIKQVTVDCKDIADDFQKFLDQTEFLVGPFKLMKDISGSRL